MAPKIKNINVSVAGLFGYDVLDNFAGFAENIRKVSVAGLFGYDVLAGQRHQAGCQFRFQLLACLGMMCWNKDGFLAKFTRVSVAGLFGYDVLAQEIRDDKLREIVSVAGLFGYDVLVIEKQCN